MADNRSLGRRDMRFEEFQDYFGTDHKKWRGIKPVKNLSHQHKKAIVLHLIGRTGSEIAEELGMSVCRVSVILNDPQSKEFIAMAHEATEAELYALFPKAVGVVRNALDNVDSPALALKASDMLFKATGKYQRFKNDDGETAEDVIARMVEAMGNKVKSLPNNYTNTSRIIDITPLKEE